jgi:hypothetical protein
MPLHMNNIFSIIIVLALSLFAFNFLGNIVQDDSSNAQEFALGLDNTAYFPTDNNLRFHCSDFEYFPIENCINDFQKHKAGTKAILYSGNSQLHGINQPELGLNSTSKILYQFLKKDYANKRLITLSIPNLNMQEQLVLNIFAGTKLPLTHLIISASFDNTRETSIRESIQPALRDPLVISTLNRMTFGKKIVKTYGEKDNAGNDLSVEQDNLQQRVEQYLDMQLADFWPAWDMRTRLRFRSIVETYQLRNRIFGITPNSIRKKIPARYKDNLAALEDLISYAKTNNLKVIFYSPPIRSDQSLPYESEQFLSYKNDVRSIVEIAGFNFYDFQNVVPPEYWGFVDDTNSNTGNKEIDFMHFQGQGHEHLADELLKSIKSLNWLDQ